LSRKGAKMNKAKAGDGHDLELRQNHGTRPTTGLLIVSAKEGEETNGPYTGP